MTNTIDHNIIPSFQLLHIIFGTTIAVWLNQILQLTTSLYLKQTGMYVVLAIVLIFALGVLPPSLFLESIAKKQYIEATKLIRKTFGAYTQIILASVSCGILSTYYTLDVIGEPYFSLTFFIAFIALMVTDIFLLWRATGG